MARLARLKSKVVTLWESTQVELHGHYSVAHLQEFERYHATTSWLRVALVCVLTPLPCALLVLAVDLMPLEPISNGSKGSPRVWLRNLMTVFEITLCTCEQIRYHVPRLRIRPGFSLLTGVAAACVSVGFCFQLSLIIGYPLPFNMVMGTVPWVIVIATMVIIYRWHDFRRHPGLATEFARYLVVGYCQVTMTVVYPLFNYFYKHQSSVHQTIAILLLPVMKIVAKNWISRALPDSDDAKPEAVVFNVEIFHSLFVSLCMSSTTSSRTVIALMVIDLIQAWLSFRDALGFLKNIDPIMQKLEATRSRTSSTISSSRHGLEDLLGMSNQIITTEPFQARHTTRTLRPPPTISTLRASLSKSARTLISGARASISALHPSSIVPADAYPPSIDNLVRQTPTTRSSQVSPSTAPSPAPSLPTDLASLTLIERGLLVRQTQKVLFLLEFVILVEYVEVIMPMMYNIYVVALFYLPNRVYYPFLQHIDHVADLVPAITNVLLYASLEFVSLIAITWIVWWKLRLSIAHQLAFVLEQRCGNIQAKMLLWMLDMMQTAIIQLGADYSLQFRWLRRPNTADSKLA